MRVHEIEIKLAKDSIRVVSRDYTENLCQNDEVLGACVIGKQNLHRALEAVGPEHPAYHHILNAMQAFGSIESKEYLEDARHKKVANHLDEALPVFRQVFALVEKMQQEVAA